MVETKEQVVIDAAKGKDVTQFVDTEEGPQQAPPSEPAAPDSS